MKYNYHHCTRAGSGDSLALGTQFNILNGLRMDWLHGGAQSGSPFYSIDNQNLITLLRQDTKQNAYPLFGPWIQLSFHSNFTDLLREFLNIWKFEGQLYEPIEFTKQPNFATNDSAQNIVAELLGIQQH